MTVIKYYKMRISFSLFILLFLISCDGQRRNNKEVLYNLSDPTNLSDLEVIYEISDNYYSSADSIFARHYVEESKTVRVALTVEDKLKIFEALKKADILTMPAQLERGVGTCVLPSFSTSITVKFGKVEKRIHDGGYCEAKDKDMEERFNLIDNTIWEIVSNKEEVKSLPDSDKMYM